MNTREHNKRRAWVLGAGALAALLLASAVFTPWGRAFAQTLMQYFTPAESSTFPVPADLAQTVPAGAPTAAPPAGLPGCEGQTGAQALACQAAQAEAAVGYDLKLPADDIPGLTFIYAQVNVDQGFASFVYNAVGGGAGLSLSQAKGALGSVQWEAVPPEAVVETVSVGGSLAEYVRGTFVVYAGAQEAVWNPEAPVQRLRWREGETQFEIRLDGAVEAVEHLDREALIALAESLR
jgi:hypothetical protein